MNRKNRPSLTDRVGRAAEAALAAQGFVSPIDVLIGIGWLDPGAVERWRRGQTDCLERDVQSPRVPEALALFGAWAADRGLSPSLTDYIARTPQRPTLRFSHSGNDATEWLYRTHWVSPALSEKKRERLVEKANRAPDLVVVVPLHSGWKCHRCGGTGDFLIMEDPGPACMRCVGLGDLEFLGAGDALLTRRAKAKSTRCAVVVRFSKTRRRYERRGLLVEPQALAEAQREVDAERSR
jgi:hypothetical protein